MLICQVQPSTMNSELRIKSPKNMCKSVWKNVLRQIWKGKWWFQHMWGCLRLSFDGPIFLDATDSSVKWKEIEMRTNWIEDCPRMEKKKKSCSSISGSVLVSSASFNLPPSMQQLSPASGTQWVQSNIQGGGGQLSDLPRLDA